ncbi:hypothetical protein, partial [Escherichia coli]|uniref:hypothetical protein n=1 Tax=Escherichia coli TaxID=562 RepID=UPI001FCD214D
MNFRAIFLSMQRVLGIFSRRENDVVELIKQDPSSLSPFAQIVGDQKYTVPDHPNLEVLKFIEYPTRPAGIQTFNEQSILSLYRGARRIRKKSYAKVFRASVRAETSRL